MRANKFVFTELDDSSKIPKIENSIRSHEGINAVRVDAVAKTITVDYDENAYTKEDIKEFIGDTGLEITKIR